MKISINTLRQLNRQYDMAADPAPQGVDALVEAIGAQLGAVEEVIDFGHRYQDAVIVEVVMVADHPDADKLHICKVDDGGVVQDVERDEDNLVQVVCGAPNVRQGMLAVWLPPGATVPETYDTEPFVLTAKPLRGVVSNGMLASARELAIGDDHSGIIEVDQQVTPGTLFAEAYELTDDTVIDIENKMFTHRPDCFGILGVAREIAGIQGQTSQSPDWYNPNTTLPAPQGDQLPLTIHNELPQVVPRFVAVVMNNITINPSPLWLRIALTKVGIRPINNIVDITNYYMVLTGQPLHAYDYDRVKAFGEGDPVLTVRYPRADETITLLNGKTIQPRPQAMMVAAGDHLICVGGAIGGADTEVSDTTTTIILEAANWDMYEMRRTAMAHGIFTDAVTRFTKGQSPLQNVAVIAAAAAEITTLAGGQIASQLIDDNHLPAEVSQRGNLHAPVVVTAPFINERLGSDLAVEVMVQLLRNVEFDVVIDGDQLTVAAPFWRTDIEIPEDIVEEVGRLYGYDKLVLRLPRRDITPAIHNADLQNQDRIRAILARAGANELQTYTFVHGDLLAKAGQDATKAYAIRNALSPDLQYYRLSLLPSLLDKVHANIKQGFREFALFELGKVHHKQYNDSQEPGLPAESQRLAMVFAADDKAAQAYSGAPYYQAKKMLAYAADKLGITLTFVELPPETATEEGFMVFLPKRAALVQSVHGPIGVIGEFRAPIQKNFKLPAYSAGFELNLEALQAATATTSPYRQLSQFPGTEQDLCLRVPIVTTYAQLKQVVEQTLSTNAELSVHVEPVDIYQRSEDAAYKQITFRIMLRHNQRTLTTDDANQLIQGVVQATGELGATQV